MCVCVCVCVCVSSYLGVDAGRSQSGADEGHTDTKVRERTLTHLPPTRPVETPDTSAAGNWVLLLE